MIYCIVFVRLLYFILLTLTICQHLLLMVFSFLDICVRNFETKWCANIFCVYINWLYRFESEGSFQSSLVINSSLHVMPYTKSVKVKISHTIFHIRIDSLFCFRMVVMFFSNGRALLLRNQHFHFCFWDEPKSKLHFYSIFSSLFPHSIDF